MVSRTKITLPSGWSDGSPNQWPQKLHYIHQLADRFYHEKLADLWMDHTNQAVQGESYIFTELPTDYRVYTKARNSGLIDRYIFGNVNGRFDSPNKFFEHFKYMMYHGTKPCTCINCPGEKVPQKAGQYSTTRSLDAIPKENDTFHPLLQKYIKLCKGSTSSEVSKIWERRPSTEFFVEGQSFQNLARMYRKLPSFLPRKGELVLFYSNEEKGGGFEEITQHFKLYDKASGIYSGFPHWRGGIITQEPAEGVSLEYLSPYANKGSKGDHYKYKISLYPDPDSDDKYLSTQSHQVTLSHIRPLSMFHEVLSGIPQVKWHETIHNALKVMCTANVVDPIRFCGTWPRATVECRGVWIGAELLILGDAVRLLPQGSSEDSHVNTVLIIDGIDWSFHQMDIDEHLSSIFVRGKLYTTDKSRALRDTPLSELEKEEAYKGCLPSSFTGYKWYPVSGADEKDGTGSDGATIEDQFMIPISLVIGRLYESEAMKHLLDMTDFDTSDWGIEEARRWARRKRGDRAKREGDWLLMNDRIEALAIEAIDSSTVGKGRERERLLAEQGNSLNTLEEYSVPTKEQGRPANNKPSQVLAGLQANVNASLHGSNWKTNIESGGTVEINTDSDDSRGGVGSSKPIATDRALDCSRDEDTDQNIFISQAIAGNIIDSEDGEAKEESSTILEKEDDSEDLRASKRPRIESV